MASYGLGSNIPRLFTRMSVLGTLSMNAATPSALERSAATPSTFACATRSTRRFLAASTFFWVRPLMTTSAPASARPWAIAKPMPDVEPVTTAWLLRMSILMVVPRWRYLVRHHEPGGGPNTQRRVWSGLRQIHIFPSGLGVASSNGTNSVSPTTQPLPVTAIWSGDSQSLSPQHHSPAGFL